MKRKFKILIKMAVQNLLLPVIYRFYCLLRKADPNKVVFADSHSADIPFSMRCLYEQMEQGTFEISLCIWDNSRLGIGSVIGNTIHFMKEYASAGTVVICDNFLPVASCRKRPQTKVIQLWHAGGALKRFGYDAQDDIPKGYCGNVYKNYDIVTVSSDRVKPYFASAMHLPEECFVSWGVSRTDYFFDKKYCETIKKRFYQQYPEAQDKKIVLWAPTFRGNAGEPRVMGLEIVDQVAQKIKEEYLLIKSLHPHMRENTDEDAFFCAEELLVVADILITDYSSIIFDFLLFHRPVIRFTPDYPEYVKTRGFYMPYESLPGQQVCRGEELEEAIRQADQVFDEKCIRQAQELSMEACDGKVTARIVQYIEKWRKEQNEQ